MKDERPVNLDLLKFRFPVMAITSVLHRITGVIIFLFIPVMLYILQQSLLSQRHFVDLQRCLSQPLSKCFLWLMIVAVLYHLFAGIRHLMMDMGCGESKRAGRVTAWSVILLSGVLAVCAGVWLIW